MNPSLAFPALIRKLRRDDSRCAHFYSSKETRIEVGAARDLELLPATEGALDLKLNLTQIIDGYPGHVHTFPIHPLYKMSWALRPGPGRRTRPPCS